MSSYDYVILDPGEAERQRLAEQRARAEAEARAAGLLPPGHPRGALPPDYPPPPQAAGYPQQPDPTMYVVSPLTQGGPYSVEPAWNGHATNYQGGNGPYLLTAPPGYGQQAQVYPGAPPPGYGQQTQAYPGAPPPTPPAGYGQTSYPVAPIPAPAYPLAPTGYGQQPQLYHGGDPGRTTGATAWPGYQADGAQQTWSGHQTGAYGHTTAYPASYPHPTMPASTSWTLKQWLYAIAIGVLVLVILDGIALRIPGLADRVRPIHDGVLGIFSSLTGQSMVDPHSVVPVPPPPGREFALQNQPTISFAAYQAELQRLGSPLLPDARQAYADLVSAGIDPAIQVVVVAQDTQGAGAGALPPPQGTRNIHNLVSLSRAGAGSVEPAAFDSYPSAVRAWIQWVTENVVSTQPQATLDTIVGLQCVAPSCDPAQYVAQMQGAVTAVRQGTPPAAGTAPVTP